MRAWRFHEPGDIRNLVLEDVGEPAPKDGEVLVRIETAALNPADHYLVLGQYPRAGAPPFTPGRDGAGVVETALSGGRFKQGDHVILLGGQTGISTLGTLAEYSAIPEAWLAPLPDGWSVEQGAAGPLVLLTAWRALVVCGGLKAGETVLITGASGGVGTAAVQLAKLLGAHVVALSRSEEKRRRLEALGADTVLDAGAGDLEKQVKAAVGAGRIDLVVENLGGTWLNRCVRMVGAGGRIMVVGLLDGLSAELAIGLLIHKCLRIEGLSVSAYTAEEAQAAWAEIVARLDIAKHRPIIDSVHPMERIQEAFARLKSGPMGKVVIAVRGARPAS